jgi:tryptophan synthase alpha chain
MPRLHDHLASCRRQGDKALGIFLTSGFPDPESTLPILRAIDESGADFIELGMPFSDPLAEGLPIQRSSERALRHGIRMDDAFQTVEKFRAGSETPVLLMGYVNPILRYGVGNFCRAARSSGVDGLILPDLPPEEGQLIDDEAAAAGLGLVYLIAPNTSEARIRLIDERTTAFVYAVSITGLTGSGLGEVDAVERYLERARSLVTRNPLMVGFGIRTHADARRLSRHTDGVIVGSALITLVEQLWDNAAVSPETRLRKVRRFIHALKYGDVEIAR